MVFIEQKSAVGVSDSADRAENALSEGGDGAFSCLEGSAEGVFVDVTAFVGEVFIENEICKEMRVRMLKKRVIFAME